MTDRDDEHAQTIDLDDLVDRYIDVWNDGDPSSRRQKIDAIWAQGGRYVDPFASASGQAEFDDLVHGAQQQFVGLRFRRGPVFDAHHNLTRFTWELVRDDEREPIAVGFDVAEVDENGRIVRVSGFLDVMPT